MTEPKSMPPCPSCVASKYRATARRLKSTQTLYRQVADYNAYGTGLSVTARKGCIDFMVMLQKETLKDEEYITSIDVQYPDLIPTLQTTRLA